MLLHTDILDKVRSAFTVAFAHHQGYALKDINALKRNGELDVLLDEVDHDDTMWFHNLFQAHVDRAGVLIPLGELLDCDEFAPGGEDAQAPLNPRKVQDVLLKKETSMVHLLTMYNDIEVVKVAQEGNAWIGGGRHRRAALVNFFHAIGFDDDEMRQQLIRVQLLTFTARPTEDDDRPAYSHASRYVVASNGSRTMTPAERNGYVLTSTLGVHHRNTDDLITSVSQDISKLGTVCGLVWRNLDMVEGNNHPVVSLTDETFRKMGASFVRKVQAIKEQYVYEDGSPVNLPSGTPKQYRKYELYINQDVESFIVTAYDALCDATEQMKKLGTLPTNTALDYASIVDVAVSVFENWLSEEMPEDCIPAPLPKPKKQPKQPHEQPQAKQVKPKRGKKTA